MSRRRRGPLDRVAQPLGTFREVMENFVAVAGGEFGFDGLWLLVIREDGLESGAHWGEGPKELPAEARTALAERVARGRLVPGEPVQGLGGGLLAAELRLQGSQQFLYSDLGIQVAQRLLLVIRGLTEEGLGPEQARGLVLLAQQSFNLAYVGAGLGWTGNLSTGLFQLSPYGMVRKNPGPGYAFNRRAGIIAGMEVGGGGSVRRIEDLLPEAEEVGLTELIRRVEHREEPSGEIEFEHRINEEERIIRAKVSYLDIGPDEEEWASVREGSEGNYWVIIGLEDVTERVRRQRLDRELELARSMQVQLMPQEVPEIPGIELAAFSASASEMNGDFYDLITTEQGALVLAVGDVSGHGIPAGLGMALAKSALHTALGPASSLAELMGRINQTLTSLTDKRTFVTLCLAWIDPRAGELVLTSGGHPPAIHRTVRDGQTEFLELEAYPTGVKAGIRFPVLHRKIAPGDLLVFYSDGIVEALDEEDRVFGYERLEALVSRYAHRSPRELSLTVAKALDRFQGGRPRLDDQTLLAVRIGEV